MKTVALVCSAAPNQYFVRPKYIRYLEKTSALCGIEVLPVLLPLTENITVIRSYAEQFDGYFFPGGDDIDPALYGEEIHEKCGNIERERDRFELALLKELTERDRPVFGICRGCQVMNVALGGTLWQDQESMIPLSRPHAEKNEDGSPRHKVRTSGFLRELTGKNEIITNSYHHQSIKRTGDNLEICAVSEDGITESIAHRTLSFYRAVQWHPEINPDEISVAILTDFLRHL